MICSNCKNQINDQAVYCNYCGKKHNPSGVDRLESNYKTEYGLTDKDGNILFSAPLEHLTKRPDWNFYIKRAGEIINESNFYEALEYCNKALELNQDEPLIYNRLGLVHYNLGKHEKAISYYNKALELDPYYTPSLSNRAIIKSENGLLIESLSDYNKVISLDPKDTTALHNRANVKYELKDYTGAKEDILTVITIDGEDGPSLYILGITLLKLGDTKEGIQNLRKSSQLGFQLAIEELENLNL
jgi:tetratricopeptide (TPR) repeat protein